MTLPQGYRFFRDDALLELRERETLYCDRCDQLYWKDNSKREYKSKGSYVGDNLCPNCIALIRSRVNALQNVKRKSCPIKSGEWIYEKHHHIILNDEDLFYHSKKRYDAQMESMKISEYNTNLKRKKDYWSIVKCKTIKELKKKKRILKKDYKRYY
jgi:hypothetical protein